MPVDEAASSAAQVALALGAGLHARGIEYAVGGALAMNFWSEPRGTIDVDITLFLPMDQPTLCIRALQQIGCDVKTTEAMASIQEHGYCRAVFRGVRVDIFLPTMPFFASARSRTSTVNWNGRYLTIWQAEPVAVLKLMFFRDKDLTDLKTLLRVRGDTLDRAWVREQIVSMCGENDPRVRAWDEMASDRRA